MSRFFSPVHGIAFILAFLGAGIATQSRGLAQAVQYSTLDVEKLQKEQPVFRTPPTAAKDTAQRAREYLFHQVPDEPVGEVGVDIRKELRAIREMSQKESTDGANDPQSPVAVPDQHAGTVPPPQTQNPADHLQESGLTASSITPDKDGLIARLTDGRVIPVLKTEEGAYITQDGKKVHLLAKDKQASTSEPKQWDSLFLIILASASTLAAIYIGFIAVDYQRRLEQAIANQNQRFTAPGDSSLSFDPFSTEPETFRFSDGSNPGLENLDIKTSFRTIA